MVTTDFIVACVLSRETNSAMIGPWKPNGILKAMLITMLSVAANTIRPTSCVRCGYGASSSRRNSHTQFDGFEVTAGVVTMLATSISANDNHRRFAQTKRVRSRLGNVNADRVARREMHPVQCALHIRQPVSKIADDLAGGCHTIADAVDDAMKAHRGARQAHRRQLSFRERCV